ncbi:MAG: hypothetical protein V3R68_04835 [Gammaproteobacteria bacterium]
MQDINRSDIENRCNEISGAFQGVLSWKWDDRFETVLAEFDVDNIDSVRAILERYLGTTWDSSNIGNAPDAVYRVNDDFGGLMPGQFLFTSDPDQDGFVYCAWWPWGNGNTVSLRIAPSQGKLSASGKDEQITMLKACFGI